MKKLLAALSIASLLAINSPGCDLAVFDGPKDAHWVDKPYKRAPTYMYFPTDVGIRWKDNRWKYYLSGVIANLDTIDITVNSVYDTLYDSKYHYPGFQTDTGYVGRMIDNSFLDGLIPDPIIPKPADSSGYRNFLIEGDANWGMSDTVNLVFLVKMDSVVCHNNILAKEYRSKPEPKPDIVQFWSENGKPKTRILPSQTRQYLR